MIIQVSEYNFKKFRFKNINTLKHMLRLWDIYSTSITVTMRIFCTVSWSICKINLLRNFGHMIAYWWWFYNRVIGMFVCTKMKCNNNVIRLLLVLNIVTNHGGILCVKVEMLNKFLTILLAFSTGIH